MQRAFTALLRKEGYHILRDRRTLAVLIVMPLLQVVLFGYAIRTDVERIRLAIVDPAPDATTLALRARFAATPLFRTVAVLRDLASLEPMLARGEVQAAIVLESGLADRIARGDPAQVLVIADATEPNTGSAMQGYAVAVIDGYARELGAGGHGVRIVPEARMRFNPTRESANLFVPGLMAFLLTIIAALMTAISLTREKETGTMEVLLVSPLRPGEIILGKVLPYVGVGFMSVLAVVAEARLIFDVPLEGSLLLLLVEGVIFILTSLAVGILISARTSSQRVAMIAALAGTMLPNVVLSGFIFPIESMPPVLQWVSAAIPARWFVVIARGIMLNGVGLRYLWSETLILVAMAALLLALSVRSFRIRLE